MNRCRQLKLVFFGDSLTCRTGITCNPDPRARFIEKYHASYVDMLLKKIMLHFPELSLLFWNQGKGGDTTEDLIARLELDVLSLRPDYVFLFIGQNDAESLSQEKFEQNIKYLADKIKVSGSTLIQYSTTPSQNEYKNQILTNLDQVIAKCAQQNHHHFINLKQVFERVISSNKQHLKHAELFTDVCHLSENGNILIADTVFEYLKNNISNFR